jgi:hypothetical protein
VKKSIISSIFWEKGLVLDPTGYYRNITRLNYSLLSTDTQANCASNYRNKLLMRMLVTSDLRAGLHSPIDHRALVSFYDRTAPTIGVDPLGGRNLGRHRDKHSPSCGVADTAPLEAYARFG